MTKGNRGFTLLELLVVIIVIGVLFSYAVATTANFLNSVHRQSEISELVTLLNLARNTAVTEGQSVTVCSLGSDNRCTSDWTGPLTAFRDPDRSKTVTQPSQIIRQFQPENGGTLKPNGGIRNYFRFRNTGMAREAIGNLTWCPRDGNRGLAAQLRINMGGRILLATDKDGDGIVEDSQGRPINCP